MNDMTTYGLDQNRITERLDWKRKQASQREQQLFTVLAQVTDAQERELLEYLYAYTCPLPDLADYAGGLFCCSCASCVRHTQANAVGKDDTG